MHDAAYRYVAETVASLTAPPGPVLEIGSRNVNGSVRALFASREFFGSDIEPGPGVDLVADGASIYIDKSPAIIVTTETLEHTPQAEAICRNAYRLLQPGGVFIVTCAGDGRAPHSAIDGGPLREGEYYRNVSPTTLRSWLSDFTGVVVRVQGEDLYATAYKGTPAPAPRGRALRVLLVQPGASWSTEDVYAGLHYGLEANGMDVRVYRLDERIGASHKWIYVLWRQKNKARKAEGLEPYARPMPADILYHAGNGVLEMALRHQVDVVLIVSAMFLHPDLLVLLKRAGLFVTILFTEAPYDLEQECKIAGLVDGCWTTERTAVSALRAVNARSGYLPHGWHPERHRPDVPMLDVPAHDVVFVGSGFAERIAWFNAIDWSGIDLGLYGPWKARGLKKALRRCIHAEQIENVYAASLYRRAKVGLNLYRTHAGEYAGKPARRVTGESLSPRAYELAACGAFHLSDYRAEVAEVFDDLVPTFRTPADASQLIRASLADEASRARIAAQLPARVAESSWVARAARVLGDVQALLAQRAA